MALTVTQIKSKEFKTKTFGYSKTEVREFLLQIANEVYQERNSHTERLQEENRNKELLTQENSVALTSVEDLKRREKMIQQTLIIAQQTRTEIIENAQKEAENIVKEAELKAKKTINEARHYLNQLDYEFIKLKEEKRLFLLNTMATVKSFLERLEKEPILSRISKNSRVSKSPQKEIPKKNTVKIDNDRKENENN